MLFPAVKEKGCPPRVLFLLNKVVNRNKRRSERQERNECVHCLGILFVKAINHRQVSQNPAKAGFASSFIVAV